MDGPLDTADVRAFAGDGFVIKRGWFDADEMELLGIVRPMIYVYSTANGAGDAWQERPRRVRAPQRGCMGFIRCAASEPVNNQIWPHPASLDSHRKALRVGRPARAR